MSLVEEANLPGSLSTDCTIVLLRLLVIIEAKTIKINIVSLTLFDKSFLCIQKLCNLSLKKNFKWTKRTDPFLEYWRNINGINGVSHYYQSIHRVAH